MCPGAVSGERVAGMVLACREVLAHPGPTATLRGGLHGPIICCWGPGRLRVGVACASMLMDGPPSSPVFSGLGLASGGCGEGFQWTDGAMDGDGGMHPPGALPPLLFPLW